MLPGRSTATWKHGVVTTGLLAEAEALSGRMLDVTRALVEVESPSEDPAACRTCVDLAGELAMAWLGAPAEIREHGRHPMLMWGTPRPRVLVLGHLDTVWPIGTIARLPWSCDGERMRGPGVFDMKAGVVQAMAALRLLGLGPDDGVALMLTSDEEIGSRGSQDVIREVAREAAATLVVEPSIDGALKTARKGTSWYELQIRGLAAHAGLEPEKGVNALLEAAHLVTEIATYGDADAGTTVTPTTARAGVTSNTVPDEAFVGVDVRAWSAAEQRRVDDLIRGWTPMDARATYTIAHGGINRAAMEPEMSAALFAQATAVAERLGLPRLEERWVGGASDGNITAEIGVPTLDGLGAVGDGAHAEHEWASVPAMPQRAALLAGLIEDLLRD